MLEAIDQAKLREDGEIGYDVELRRRILGREDPKHVAVPKGIDDRRMGVAGLVGEAMMLAVMRNPPQRTALRSGGTGEGTGELDRPADLESPVREAAMVERGDAEGPDRVGDERGDDGELAPADEEDAEESKVRGDEWCRRGAMAARLGSRPRGRCRDR